MKRLYRSKKDRMIAGVCGGMAEYFEVDPVIVRVLFVLAAFMGGVGVILYILLAIMTPEEGEKMESDTVSGETTGAATIHDPPLHLPKTSKDRRWLFGVIILVIGAIMLIDELSISFPWWGWNFLWPIIIIGLGLYVFVNYRNKEK